MAELEPLVGEAYADVAGDAGRGAPALRAAVARRPGWPPRWPPAATDDLRRGVTLVGPHRDDLDLDLDGLPARTHASQGEQRSWPSRCAWPPTGGHRATSASPPVLLLDDVFSELDPDRSRRPARATCPPARSCSPPPGRCRPAPRPARDPCVVARRADRSMADDGACDPIGDEPRRRGARRSEARRREGHGAAVFARWEELVGTARRGPRPARCCSTTARLVVAVDEPGWATQLRFLEADLLERLAAVAGRRRGAPDRGARPPLAERPARCADGSR